jgi:hypothetical protein
LLALAPGRAVSASWRGFEVQSWTAPVEGDIYFRSNKPLALSLHPLRRVATTNNDRTIRIAEMPAPNSGLEREWPVSADINRARLSLIDNLTGRRSVTLEQLPICSLAGQLNAKAPADGHVICPERRNFVGLVGCDSGVLLQSLSFDCLLLGRSPGDGQQKTGHSEYDEE